MAAIHPFLAFFIALGVSFGSAIPFGPINLSVVNTTLRNDYKSGIIFSLAAALVEIVQSLVAMYCSRFMADFFMSSPFIKVAAFVLFMVIGLVFLLKKNKVKDESKSKSSKTANFFKGMFIALANPQTLPFWIFVLTYLETVQMIPINLSSPWSIIIAFMIGVSLGRFLGLSIFTVLSHHIRKKSDKITYAVNKGMGIFLIILGVIQGIQVFFM